MIVKNIIASFRLHEIGKALTISTIHDPNIKVGSIYFNYFFDTT